MTSEQIGNVNFTGLLGDAGVRTPWAEDGVAVNVGIEYRRESLELNPDDVVPDGRAISPARARRLFRSAATSASGKFSARPRSRSSRTAGIEEFTVNVGYRQSWYELSNDRTYDTATYKISAELAPIRDIRFRGAYNRAARAPNIQELFAPISSSASTEATIRAPRVVTATDYGCIAQGLAIGQSPSANPAGQYNGLHRR